MLAILERVLAAVLQALGILQFVNQYLHLGLPDALDDIENAVNNDYDKLRLMVGTNNVPQTTIVDLALTLMTDDGLTLRDVINAMPGSAPITLPSPPPVEYHPTTPAENWANALTPYDPIFGSFSMTADLVMQAAAEAGWASAYTKGLRPYTRHDFSLVSNRATLIAVAINEGWNGSPLPYPPAIDWSKWLYGQPLVNFLNQEDSVLVWGWEEDDNGNSRVATSHLAAGEFAVLLWRCDVAEWELPFRSGKWLNLLTSQRLTPPSWPGIDGVTLGSPVALSAGFTIEEGMDGVIVEITSTPARMQTYLYDDALSYVHAGSISFYDDQGHQEAAQGYSFSTHLLTPRTMVRASGVKVRTATDVAGTVTPWSIK